MKSKEMTRTMRIHCNYNGYKKNQLKQTTRNWQAEELTSPRIQQTAGHHFTIILFSYKLTPNVD